MTGVCGHNIPRLIDKDDELLVFEMTAVVKPYVLDFATAYLDERPDFPEEVWEERMAHWADAFESNWPHARRIMAQFERMGIFLLDPSPANIGFTESGESSESKA